MDERVLQFRVGVMVLATLIITAILVLLFGNLPTMLQGTYTIYIHFPSAGGVSVDTPVRMNGLLIGRVSEVGFAEAGGVMVTTKIESKVKLHRTDIPRITTSLLGGDGEIQFVPEERKPGVNDLLKPGDLILGRPAPSDPLQVIGNLEGDLSKAIGSVAGTSDQIGQLASQVNDLLRGNDEQFGRIVRKFEQTLDGLQTAVASTNEVLGDSELKGDLKDSIAKLPQMLEEMRNAAAGMQKAVDTVDRNMQNLEGFTRPLGERGDSILANIDNSTAKLDDALDQLVTFGRNLNSSEGSLGQLINSPELYQRLNTIACNIENLTRELRPIVRDARSFSDKIARHPEKLGVRGLIDRSSGIK